MPLPSQTALKARARTLLEAMTERARWIYALPREADATVPDLLRARGLHCQEESAGASRWTLGVGASLVLLSSADLDVLLVEAAGADAAPVLAEVLDETGFYAQSELLRAALDVRDPECVKALRTLAHMVVAWDEDHSDLFLLHLASPDAVVRHEAVASVTLAAMVARDAGPALSLLRDARAREKFPKLCDTIDEAIAVVSAATGGPAEIDPLGSPA